MIGYAEIDDCTLTIYDENGHSISARQVPRDTKLVGYTNKTVTIHEPSGTIFIVNKDCQTVDSRYGNPF